jgi:hypothetical protein
MRTLLVLAMTVALSTCTATAPVLAAPAKKAVAKYDCGVFYMGAGGYLFSAPLSGVRATFARGYPSAWTTLNHHWGAGVPDTCKRPLIVGHSLGAIKAVKEGNRIKRGRVISIDPPNWYTNAYGLKTTRPTVNFYHCPPSPYGCGRVTGVNGAINVDLSKEGLTHVPLPNSKRIHQEVLR